MLELFGFAILLIAAGTGAYFLERRKHITRARRRPAINRYRGVAIRHSLLSCRAVNALDGKLFLAMEAPSLPVKGCDVWPCRCHYEYLTDRRIEERRSLYGSQHNLMLHSLPLERRGRDRRQVSEAFA
jgi:hypothetical protein